jgi:hypothetical protein
VDPLFPASCSSVSFPDPKAALGWSIGEFGVLEVGILEMWSFGDLQIWSFGDFESRIQVWVLSWGMVVAWPGVVLALGSSPEVKVLPGGAVAGAGALRKTDRGHDEVRGQTGLTRRTEARLTTQESHA